MSPLGRGMFHAGIAYDTVGGAITNRGADGCTVAYNGVGDSSITLDRPLDNTEMCILATIRDAAIGCVRYVNTSDAVKQMICRDEAAGALAAGERGLDVVILDLNQLDRKLVNAAGHYQGSAAAGAVAFGQRGGVVTRSAAGVYDITLDRPVAAADCSVQVTIGVGAGAATDLHARVTHTSDTVKRVTIETLAAGADIDADFCWAVFNLLAAPDTRCYGIGSIAAAGGTPLGRGCIPSRNGAGDYRYAMDRSSAAGGWIGLVTPIGATGMAVRVVDAAVARKDVASQTQAGPGTATDVQHSAVFLRLA
jgi:hypothetical protein